MCRLFENRMYHTVQYPIETQEALPIPRRGLSDPFQEKGSSLASAFPAHRACLDLPKGHLLDLLHRHRSNPGPRESIVRCRSHILSFFRDKRQVMQLIHADAIQEFQDPVEVQAHLVDPVTVIREAEASAPSHEFLDLELASPVV